MQPVGDIMARVTNDVRELNFMFNPGDGIQAVAGPPGGQQVGLVVPDWCQVGVGGAVPPVDAYGQAMSDEPKFHGVERRGTGA